MKIFDIILFCPKFHLNVDSFEFVGRKVHKAWERRAQIRLKQGWSCLCQLSQKRYHTSIHYSFVAAETPACCTQWGPGVIVIVTIPTMDSGPGTSVQEILGSSQDTTSISLLSAMRHADPLPRWWRCKTVGPRYKICQDPGHPCYAGARRAIAQRWVKMVNCQLLGCFFHGEQKMEDNMEFTIEKWTWNPKNWLVWVDVVPFSKGACSGSMFSFRGCFLVIVRCCRGQAYYRKGDYKSCQLSLETAKRSFWSKCSNESLKKSRLNDVISLDWIHLNNS